MRNSIVGKAGLQEAVEHRETCSRVVKLGLESIRRLFTVGTFVPPENLGQCLPKVGQGFHVDMKSRLPNLRNLGAFALKLRSRYLGLRFKPGHTSQLKEK